MRIVCFAIPEKGHIHPLLPTLRVLADAGHDVCLVAGKDMGPVLHRAGIAARSLVLDVPPPPESFVTQGRLFAEKLRDAEWLAGWIEALLIDPVPRQVPACAAVLAHERPDVVIADPMLYAVAIACALANVPWAALSSSLNPVTPADWRTDLTDTLDRLRDRRALLFAQRGLPVPRFFVSDVESPWLNVAFTAQAYVPHSVDPAIQLVGAPFDPTQPAARGDEAPFPWDRLGTRKRLYCSFGSQAFFQPGLFRRVFAAARMLDLQLIGSVGELVDDPSFLREAPEDAILVRYAPQLALLPEVDCVISHGGANSAVETLTFGRPLLLLPLCNDQPLQARFLRASGAGSSLDARSGDVDPEQLTEALRTLLSGPAPERAGEIGQALRSAGGPRRAAQLVLQLAGERGS